MPWTRLDLLLTLPLSSHLARDEGRAAAGALMVKENSVGKVHAVSLAVVDDHPVGVLLGHPIRRARVERRRLGLRDLAHLR